MLRHAQRHIQESARLWIYDRLELLDWMDDDSTIRPFRSGKVEISSTFTGVEGTDPKRWPLAGTIDPKVGVLILGQDRDIDMEVGGPGVQVTYDLCVSIVAIAGLASPLFDDVLDLIAGRSDRPVIPFYDMASERIVADETLEVEQASGGRATPERADWLLVQASIVRSFSRSWAY